MSINIEPMLEGVERYASMMFDTPGMHAEIVRVNSKTGASEITVQRPDGVCVARWFAYPRHYVHEKQFIDGAIYMLNEFRKIYKQRNKKR